MRFDWYQATVPTDEVTAQRCIEASFPQWILNPARPLNGYEHAVSATFGDETVCMMLWGRHHPGVHLKATGETAHPASRWIRSVWPAHQVSRADACADYRGEGAWERLSRLFLHVADENRIVVDHQGDHHRGERGRTLTFGSTSSPVRVRVYEKGHQLRRLGVPDADPTHVRVEVQCRPQKAAKALVARLQPADLWGTSAWSAQGYHQLTGTEVSRIPVGTTWAASDDDRAYRWMLVQYGPLLQRLADAHGSWECLAATIRDDLARAHASSAGLRSDERPNNHVDARYEGASALVGHVHGESLVSVDEPPVPQGPISLRRSAAGMPPSSSRPGRQPAAESIARLPSGFASDDGVPPEGSVLH